MPEGELSHPGPASSPPTSSYGVLTEAKITASSPYHSNTTSEDTSRPGRVSFSPRTSLYNVFDGSRRTASPDIDSLKSGKHLRVKEDSPVTHRPKTPPLATGRETGPESAQSHENVTTQSGASSHRNVESDRKEITNTSASTLTNPLIGVLEAIGSDRGGHATQIHGLRAESRSARHSSSPDFDESSPWRQRIVLSLDGGGIRGYSSLLILRRLMEVIGRKEQELDADIQTSFDCLSPIHGASGTENGAYLDRSKSKSARFLPCHYFDYIAGTSTGGLSAIMLGRLRMSVDECLAQYHLLGAEIFAKGRWVCIRGPIFCPWRNKYRHTRMTKSVEKVVKERPVTTEDQRPGGRHLASHSAMCKTIVVAWQRLEKGDDRPYLFRSYDHTHHLKKQTLVRNPGSADMVCIWEAARATTAAPTYFADAKINGYVFTDGGFGANNPSVLAFNEVKQMCGNKDSAVRALISIGTGKSRPIKRVADSWLWKYWYYFNAARKWATQSEERHHDMTDRAESIRTFDYVRFNVEEGLEFVKLDQWETPSKPNALSTLDNISFQTDKYVKDQEEVIEKYADLLVKFRKTRVQQSFSKWERFAQGVSYSCPETDCSKFNEKFGDRDGLRRHICQYHPRSIAREAFTFEEECQELRKRLNECRHPDLYP